MSYIRVNAAFSDLGYYTYFCGNGNRATFIVIFERVIGVCSS